MQKIKTNLIFRGFYLKNRCCLNTRVSFLKIEQKKYKLSISQSNSLFNFNYKKRRTSEKKELEILRRKKRDFVRLFYGRKKNELISWIIELLIPRLLHWIKAQITRHVHPSQQFLIKWATTHRYIKKHAISRTQDWIIKLRHLLFISFNIIKLMTTHLKQKSKTSSFRFNENVGEKKNCIKIRTHSNYLIVWMNLTCWYTTMFDHHLKWLIINKFLIRVRFFI